MDIDAHVVKLLELLHRACPRTTLIIIRTHDQRSVRECVDELVSLHGMTDIEPGAWIKRRDQDKASLHQKIAILACKRGSFETVRQHT
jgi:ABC-type Mn2+/Zn2+ transport system ATPase subunit